MSTPIWKCRGYVIRRPNGNLATDSDMRPHFVRQLHEANQLRDEISRQLGKCKVALVTMEIREP